MPSPFRVSLLAEDPELGVGLSAEERDIAANLTVPAWQILPGVWDPPSDLYRVPASVLGLLVADGALLRELELSGTRAAEVLGPGDVTEAPHPRQDEPLVPVTISWRVLQPARLVLLPSALLRNPGALSLSLTLVGRLRARAERLAVHQAIAQLPRVDMRVLAALWHLAERFGRFGPDGVFLSLPLTHRTLGEIVGARRPTVSLAVRDLAERGHVARRPDGGWQLARVRPETLGLEPPARPRAVKPKPTGDPLERMAHDLRSATRRLRADQAKRVDVLSHTLERLVEARERAALARNETLRIRAEVRERRRRADNGVAG